MIGSEGGTAKRMSKKKEFEGPLKPGKADGPASKEAQDRVAEIVLKGGKKKKKKKRDGEDFFDLDIREVSVFENAVEEVRGGPFSILSEKAQDRLMSLFNALQKDAFERGVQEGLKKGTKSHSAGGH